MADATEIAEIAADGVADGMHVVSEEALAAEKAVRAMDRTGLAYLGLGLAIGAVAGFFVAYRKAETKYRQIAEEEISAEVDQMRQHYNEKAVALYASSQKEDLDEIVRERGYSADSTKPPMVVTPPTAVVEAAEAAQDIVETEDDEQADESSDEAEVRNIFEEAEFEDAWDVSKERRQRSPLAPYVIHQDERDEFDHYDGVTFTYYEADDVLSNERDEVVAPEDRDRLIGEANLEKFGHGSGDASIVYIRNDQLEMQFEVVRSPNSYAEEVHGFDPPEPEIRHAHRRGRSPFDDD